MQFGNETNSPNACDRSSGQLDRSRLMLCELRQYAEISLLIIIFGISIVKDPTKFYILMLNYIYNSGLQRPTEKLPTVTKMIDKNTIPFSKFASLCQRLENLSSSNSIRDERQSSSGILTANPHLILGNMRYGLGLAKRGVANQRWLTREDVVNTYLYDKLKKIFRRL
jgi:hypothetical protein